MFSRTASGIRNTDLFYPNKYIVVVEGEDDVQFWRIFFPKEVSGYECKFKTVGGSKEIKNYVDEIYNGTGNFVVALDSDYRLFMGGVHNHIQIVETVFHSIENVMIRPHILAEIIRIESRQEDYDTK